MDSSIEMIPKKMFLFIKPLSLIITNKNTCDLSATKKKSSSMLSKVKKVWMKLLTLLAQPVKALLVPSMPLIEITKTDEVEAAEDDQELDEVVLDRVKIRTPKLKRKTIVML